MSLLGLHVGATAATALVLATDGRVLATARHAVEDVGTGRDVVELAPEQVWRATLAATREVLSGVDPAALTALGVTARPGPVVLWDRETLGSPRPAIARHQAAAQAAAARLGPAGDARVLALTGRPLDAESPAAALAWLAVHEPHTWALVGSGRYAVGGLDSYLVARATRGTWHVTDPSHASSTQLLDLAGGAWSDELCELLDVPMDALPDLVPSWGEVATTDPSAFLRLALPVAGLAAEASAAHAARVVAGSPDGAPAASDRGPSVLETTGPTLAPAGAGGWPVIAWRAADGSTTYARHRTVGPGAEPMTVDPDLAALGAARLAGVGAGAWPAADEVSATSVAEDPAVD